MYKDVGFINDPTIKAIKKLLKVILKIFEIEYKEQTFENDLSITCNGEEMIRRFSWCVFHVLEIRNLKKKIQNKDWSVSEMKSTVEEKFERKKEFEKAIYAYFRVCLSNKSLGYCKFNRNLLNLKKEGEGEEMNLEENRRKLCMNAFYYLILNSSYSNLKKIASFDIFKSIEGNMPLVFFMLQDFYYAVVYRYMMQTKIESCPENPQIGLANLIEYMKGDVNINRLFNESLESLLGIEKEDLLPFFKSFLMPNYDCITSIIHKEGFNNLIKQRITEVELKSDWDESLYDWGMIKL
jgi:hypothetical protein